MPIQQDKSNNIVQVMRKLYKMFRTPNIAKHSFDTGASSARGAGRTGDMGSAQQFLAKGVGFGSRSLMFHKRGVASSFDRQGRIALYIEEDTDPYANNALDIIADFVCDEDESGNLINIESQDEKIVEILESLFFDVLNIEAKMWPMTRSLSKFGEDIELINWHPKHGVMDLYTIPVHEVEREEGFDEEDPMAVRFKWVTHPHRKLQNFEVLHFRLFGNDALMPYGTCAKKHTKVLAKSGVSEIQDIKQGDVVISFDEATQEKVEAKVLDVVHNGRKKCKTVRTKHNFVELTPEHRVAIYNHSDDVFQYKTVAELNVGDKLVLSKNHETHSDIPIDKSKPDENKNGWWNTIDNIPDYVNEDFAQLFGFLIGDGWVITSNPAIGIALGTNEEVNKKYIGLLNKFSGNYCAIKPKTNQAICHSKMLKTIMQRMGFEGKATTKRFPEWIYGADQNIQKAFMQGLFDADGSSFADKWNCTRYQLEMSNELLIRDAKALVQCLGYKSGKIGSRTRKNVIIEGREIQTIAESFYFYYFGSKLEQTTKHDVRTRLTDQYIIEPIITIEDGPEDDVYDIYVDHKDHNFFANGILVHNSILEASRRSFQQYLMMFDAMMIYRLVRAPERLAFYIELGNTNPEDVDQFLNDQKEKLKSVMAVDSSSAIGDMRYDPQTVMEDFWIPKRGDVSSRIEQIPGGTIQGDVEDIEVAINRYISGLKVPKPYLDYSEEWAKANIANLDIRFSKTIRRIQNAVITELKKVGIIHLMTMGIEDERLFDWDITMSNPSTIAELQKLEMLEKKLNIVSSAKQTEVLSSEWIYDTVLNLSDEEKSEIRRGLLKDKAREMAVEKLAEKLANKVAGEEEEEESKKKEGAEKEKAPESKGMERRKLAGVGEAKSAYGIPQEREPDLDMPDTEEQLKRTIPNDGDSLDDPYDKDWLKKVSTSISESDDEDSLEETRKFVFRTTGRIVTTRRPSIIKETVGGVRALTLADRFIKETKREMKEKSKIIQENEAAVHIDYTEEDDDEL